MNIMLIRRQQRLIVDIASQNKMIIFAIVVLLIACGIASLVKGIKGEWDQDVKPEDMVGPSNSFDTRDGPNDSDQNDTK